MFTDSEDELGLEFKGFKEDELTCEVKMIYVVHRSFLFMCFTNFKDQTGLICHHNLGMVFT